MWIPLDSERSSESDRHQKWHLWKPEMLFFSANICTCFSNPYLDLLKRGFQKMLKIFTSSIPQSWWMSYWENKPNHLIAKTQHTFTPISKTSSFLPHHSPLAKRKVALMTTVALERRHCPLLILEHQWLGSLVMSPCFTSPNHDRYMVYKCLLDGYYFWWCPIFPSHGTFTNPWSVGNGSRWAHGQHVPSSISVKVT